MTVHDPRMKVKKLRNGPVVAHSRDLMVVFRPGRHDNILTACRKAMLDHPEMEGKDFIPGRYVASNNQEQECFQVTRAGTAAMFKHLHGKHADKALYLAAFDRCEARNSPHTREEPEDLDPAIVPDEPAALEPVAAAPEPEPVAAEPVEEVDLEPVPVPPSGGPVRPFVFDDGDVRFTVRMIFLGEKFWWIAKDACAALELLGDASQHVRRLEADEKDLIPIQTPGGLQAVLAVNEAGIYNLILRSDKPRAKRFRRWVTHDVLPEIRKTGSYGPQPEPAGPKLYGSAEDLLNDPTALLTLAVGYAQQIQIKDARLAIVEPKAAALDHLGNCKGSLNLRNAAKALGMSPGWFNNRLVQMEILTYSDGRLVAYQKYVDQGWFIHKPVAVTHNSGGQEIVNQPRVTGRGLAKLAVALGVGVRAVLGQGVLDLSTDGPFH
jgi:anti-repressor protein